jgi:prepilin-type N-terminal cleavage/methylation domain-containing protein
MLRNAKGFTLVELAVVVVVIGVAVAIVGPRIDVVSLATPRLEAAANKVAAFATHARNLAVATGVPHVLCIDLRQGRYRVRAEESLTTAEADETAGPLGATLPEGVEFAGAAVLDARLTAQGTACIWFRPEGWADAAVVHLVGRNEAAKSVLIAPLLGAAEVRDGCVSLTLAAEPEDMSVDD